MTDNEAPAASAEDGPQFEIVRLYVKDISFEAPNSPAIFKEEWKPKVSFSIDTRSSALEDDLHEVLLGITVTVEQGDKTAYLCEVQHAGIFVVKHFDEAQKSHMLGAFCPSTLFPFAREVISSMVVKGGFPDLQLAPVDFHTLYVRRMEQIKQEAAAASSQATN